MSRYNYRLNTQVRQIKISDVAIGKKMKNNTETPRGATHLILQGAMQELVIVYLLSIEKIQVMDEMDDLAPFYILVHHNWAK
jgi:hypothetical protein